MQNLFANVETIAAEGKMYLGMGEGSLGMIDVRDIADSFVALLLREGHENEIFTPTGPESISFSQVAGIISEELSKSVDYVPISIEAVGEAIMTAGWGKWGADVMMDYSKAYAEGWGDFTTDDVEKVTGKKARNFRQFFSEMLAPTMN